VGVVPPWARCSGAGDGVEDTAMTDQDPTQPVELQPLAPMPPSAPSGLDVPIAPVAGAKPDRPRGGAVRWIVALLVVALVVAGGLGAALLLTGSSAGASDLAGYVPADTEMYLEARLDLPGSQRAEVAKTLSAFPGFADQAPLDAKLGEVFDRIVRAATKGGHDYQTEIAPWFGGQIALAEGPGPLLADQAGTDAATAAPNPADALPACTGDAAATPTPAPSASDTISYPASRFGVRALALVNLKDAAKAEAWVNAILASKQATSTDRTCDGVVVHVVSRNGVTFDAPEMGWAVLGGKALVAGDLDSIRLAIATKGTSGLASTALFQKAVGSLQGDHLGLVFESVRAMFDRQVSELSRVDTNASLAAAVKLIGSRLPDWVVGDLRAADGNIVATSAETVPSDSTATNRASALAGLAPSGTIALVDVHDVGKSLASLNAALNAEPAFKAYTDQINRVLGLLGGFDSSLGWIGDAGIAITGSGTRLSGGILIRPDDSSAAKHLFTQIRALADLSGATSGIKITDEPYKDATLTTVDLSGLASGAGSGMENMLGGMAVPSDLKLVYAVTDKVVVFSLDPAFAKAVIDASQGGPSLASDPRFSALLSKAGDKVTSVVWVDVAAVRGLIETAMPADTRAKYESDYKPYLLPFDALISTGTIDNGLIRGTSILSIKH
jgi:hypothetical protein